MDTLINVLFIIGASLLIFFFYLFSLLSLISTF